MLFSNIVMHGLIKMVVTQINWRRKLYQLYKEGLCPAIVNRNRLEGPKISKHPCQHLWTILQQSLTESVTHLRRYWYACHNLRSAVVIFKVFHVIKAFSDPVHATTILTKLQFDRQKDINSFNGQTKRYIICPRNSFYPLV